MPALASLGAAAASAFGLNRPPAAGGAPAKTYLGETTNNVDGSTFTFSNFAIGQPGLIVVAALTEQGSGQVSSMTIGGVSANMAASVVTSSGTVVRAELYYARVTAGSTATIVVNYPGSMVRCQIGVWRLDNISSDTPQDTGTDEVPGNSGSQSMSVTLDSQVGAVGIVALTLGSNTSTATWSGATADFNVTPESLTRCQAASFVEDGSSTVITGSFSGNSQGSAMAGAVWY